MSVFFSVGNQQFFVEILRGHVRLTSRTLPKMFPVVFFEETSGKNGKKSKRGLWNY